MIYSPTQQVVDIKYINLLSGSLRNFKKKSAVLYNFSCPKCGDSHKDQTKARGYIFQKKGQFSYFCHNCNYSKTFRNFLKEIDPRLYSEYLLELMGGEGRRKEDAQTKLPKKMERLLKPKTDHTEDFYNCCTCLTDLDSNHPAIKYVKGRCIPDHKWNLLYYTEDFRELAKAVYPEREGKVNDREKLIIPFFLPSGRVGGLQARAIDSTDTLRYCTMPVGSDSMPLYGTERVDYAKRVYIVEGPIDSLFIPNCLALARADISLDQLNALRYKTRDIVAILDNEPRNKEIVKAVRKMLARNIPVVFWDDRFKGKDINEMIENGHMPGEILMYIEKNTKSGLEAELALTEWSKSK